MEETRKMDNKARKDTLKRWIREKEKQAFQQWKEGTDRELYKEIKKEWGREEYLKWGDKDGVTLKMTFRAEAARLQKDLETCPQCCSSDKETEAHVLIKCGRYTKERRDMKTEIKDIWGQQSYNDWKQNTTIVRAAWLLRGDIGTYSQRKNADRVVKQFLKNIEKARTRRGMNSMAEGPPRRKEQYREDKAGAASQSDQVIGEDGAHEETSEQSEELDEYSGTSEDSTSTQELLQDSDPLEDLSWEEPESEEA